MPAVHRILDANANRAREALRVMEEAARFILSDADLSGRIKSLRHDLAALLVPVAGLEASRDTPGDVGTTIKGAGEQHRASVADVAIAAGKRLSEALRAIEEYAKTLDPAIAARAESLRYRGYDVEQRLTLRLGTGRSRQWKLCVLLSAELCRGRAVVDVARAAVAGGADCLQLREKAMDAGPMLDLARRLVEIAHLAGVSLIVNDRPDVALLSGADGVHLGQTDLPCRDARKLVGRQLLIGISTTNLDQARCAAVDGADYCGVGPMYATTTKRKDHIAGPDYLREFVEHHPQIPHLAIGGITAPRAAELRRHSARGIAVSSAVCCAEDPQAAAAALRQAMD